MTFYVFEGGPLDGAKMETSGAHIVRVPRPVPYGAPTDLTYSVWEYRRVGDIYRFETLIDDAKAMMDISEQVFREPEARRYARSMLREQLGSLDPAKDVDRIVWVLARDRLRFTFTIVAVVGGRRAEHAAHIREQLRSGVPYAG
jgi:hypothetical protein